MSVKLVFEYDGEDGEELVQQICQYVIEELLPEYEANGRSREAFMVGFDGNPSEWVALKRHIKNCGPQTEVVGSAEEGLEELKRQFKQRSIGEPIIKKKKNDEPKSGFSGFLGSVK